MVHPTMLRRQAAFREEFLSRIAPAYAGWGHVALIFVLGAAATWYCARQIAHPAWYEPLVIPAAFCTSNVSDWWIHKFVHRPVKGPMGLLKHIFNGYDTRTVRRDLRRAPVE
jgi:hypothetical protein